MLGKKKYLIMLDVDQTLLDTNYRSTSPTIVSVINQMKDEGHVFLLNSNRSFEDLLPIAKQFDINGHLIGENGCFIYDQATGETQVMVEPEIIQQIDELRDFLEKTVNQNFPNSKFLIDDSTDLNKNIDLLNIEGGLQNVFVLNQFRKYTISLHAKKVIDGKIVKDPEAAKKIYDLANDYIGSRNFALIPSYTMSYCNLLVVPQNHDKAKAFSVLSSIYPKYVKVVIGDDYYDKPLMREVDYFFAVGNADEVVKEVADYVAEETITKGAEEILLKIDMLTG